MSKNLHNEPFDETTIVKLEIFEDYAKAWIPTFVMQGNLTICIFDFFAGPGYDCNRVLGSPIRLLEKIKEQVNRINDQNIRVEVYFNEFDKLKFDQLQENCHGYLSENKEVDKLIKLNLSNEDFDICFNRLIPIIRQEASLVYLDQNGVRFLSTKYLLELEKMKRTDFLYFASASYLWRFGDTEEFRTYLDIDMKKIKSEPYSSVHRSLITQLKLKLSPHTLLKLYPFSLKKGANIHGIIFGATHPRAVEKFLTLAWKRNETNGEANFDIDDDAKKGQLDLFFGQKLTKIESFKDRFRRKILSMEIKDNFEAFNFALEEGHLGSHASDELKLMKMQKIIDYEGISPLVTYDNSYKSVRILPYKVLKK
jgi:three-Cys-motif partner protein